tara:strand:+ start:1626 stop:3719 length:2094 start_codon:yes stop_codon:yes gene_type:complete
MKSKQNLILRFASCTVLVCSIFIISCQEEVEQSDNGIELINTLDDPSVGSGSTGIAEDYFYNLGDNVMAEFYRFGQANRRIDYSYSDYFTYNNGEEPPILDFKSFPDFLITVMPQNEEYTERIFIDSLYQSDFVSEDSVELVRDSYKNITRLVWDTEPSIDEQKYDDRKTEIPSSSVSFTYLDTMDLLSYAAVVDTPLIDDGFMFVDSSEWVDTTYFYYSENSILFSYLFEDTRTRFNSDSLMFRKNSDCNDNGSWDDNTTSSNGNGIWDPAEVFYDINPNGAYDPNEPFEDRNCNDEWDDAEELTLDVNENGWYEDGDEFIDRDYPLFTEVEEFTDLNEDGISDSNELFEWATSPKTLLVNWIDPMNPVVMDTIEIGDSLVTRHGLIYTDIIEEVDYTELKSKTIGNIDSLVTLYTNEIIASLNGESGEFFILKSEWEDDYADSEDDLRAYNYHLFRNEEHVFQLSQPSYFKPYGYYFDELAIEGGFWHKNEFVENVLFYTPGGEIRDGEIVQEVYYDTTEIAIYKIEKTFTVESASVTAPAKVIRGFINEDGLIECYQGSEFQVSSIEECPGADTTFSDCFLVERVLTMTMVGSGVEFGERNKTWLVKDFGAVRDELDIRWSEFPGLPEEWEPLSRWELGRITIQPADNEGLLPRLFAGKKRQQLDELGGLEEFNFDPYHFHRTSGLQRVELPGN